MNEEWTISSRPGNEKPPQRKFENWRIEKKGEIFRTPDLELKNVVTLVIALNKG